MNTLPKKLNRWTILAIVILLSLVLTVFVVSKTYTSTNISNKVVSTPGPGKVNLPINDSPVSVNLKYDYTQGFVDVFITNPNSIDNGQLIFKLTGETRFSKIEENTLFEKYFTSSDTDKATNVRSLNVAGTKGMGGATVLPGNNRKFARIYFSNLKENSASLDLDNSTFFVGTGNPVYKVVLEK